MRKKLICFIMAALLLASLAGCGEPVSDTTVSTATDSPAAGTPSSAVTGTDTDEPAETDDDSADPVGTEDLHIVSTVTNGSWTAKITETDMLGEDDPAPVTTIALTGDSANISGGGASFADGYVVITAGGTYSLSGSLNGGVIVNIPDVAKAHLILRGVDITSDAYSALAVICADKVVITLADGTVNKLTDGTSYTYSYSKTVIPNACLFSKDDLTINGSGSLEVTGRFNNGISTKDDLTVLGGNISVTAANHGLRGNDLVLITDGKIDIKCKKDGIKSSNDTDKTKGFLFITGGDITVSAEDDALQAVTALYVTGGHVSASFGGKSTNCPGKVSVKAGCLTEED